MGAEQSDRSTSHAQRWNYACQICGTPFKSKPKICTDYGKGTVAPIKYVLTD
jgi:hypothetical protein